jgi:Ca2+-binding RTX toxin-like protein
VTFGALTLRGVEDIVFGSALSSGFSYKLILANTTVSAGATLKIDGYFMTAGQTLYVNGSSETDGSFLIYDGQSNDTFFGGAQSDTIGIGFGGADTVHAGGGDDIIGGEAAFNNADVVDGGAGYDVLYLRGDYSAGLAIAASALTNVEMIGMSLDFAYKLSVADGVVAAGQNLYVDGEGITGTGSITFNGSAETDGTFSFRDGVGNDTLIGGANKDVFYGIGGGSDVFVGLDGDDTFAMYGNLDATDMIFGEAGNDWVSLDGDYSSGVVFDSATIVSIETLSVTAGHNYKIKTDDGNVDAGQQLYVSAGGLGAANYIIFDGSAETDGSCQFGGGAGNDQFTGGTGNDYFDAGFGGNDKFYGGGGDDSVSFFGAYTTSDFVDGGAGSDQVYFYGNFAGGLTLGSSQMKSVESVTLGGGYSYTVTTSDSLVAPGDTMAFNTYYATAGQNFVFNGAAEVNGHFELTGGDGDDSLTGGAQSDRFFLNRAGNDVMNGGNGDDTFYVYSGFTSADSLNGGSGKDTVELAQAANLTFQATTITGIETINLYAGNGYTLRTSDANVAAAAMLTVSGSYLGATDVISFDGSAETDGRFTLVGGGAADILRGGAMNDQITGGAGNDKLYGNNGIDTLTGGLGADVLYGGLGNDKFVLDDSADSTVAAYDTIADWNAGDKINLSAIDAVAGVAGDQAFTFIGAASFFAAGQLRVVTGANTFVTGDMNGDGAADFQIKLTGSQTLTAGSFVL